MFSAPASKPGPLVAEHRDRREGALALRLERAGGLDGFGRAVGRARAASMRSLASVSSPASARQNGSL